MKKRWLLTAQNSDHSLEGRRAGHQQVSGPLCFEMQNHGQQNAYSLVMTVWVKRLYATAPIAILLGSIAVSSQDADVRQGPRVIDHKTSGVGRMIPNFQGVAVNSEPFELSSFADGAPTVIFLTSTDCPLCLKFSPELARIEDDYSKKGVNFIFVNPSESEELEAMEEAIKTHGFDSPYLLDRTGEIAATLGATTTTDAFVLDETQTLVYRGAVSDRYGLGYSRESARETYLRDALDAVLAGEEPEVKSTWAPGCVLEIDAKPVKQMVTYHNRVSRIIQQNCLSCHREGGVAPFTLDSYEKVKGARGMIRYSIENGIMPPWFDTAHSGENSIWSNDRTLSPNDHQDLIAWIDNGTPEGNPADAPKPMVFESAWQMGEPDAVLQIPRAYKIKAEGQMPYKHVKVKTDFASDVWISEVELLPTDRRAVHHILVFLLTEDEARPGGFANLDETRGFLAGYVPGTSHLNFGESFGKRIPKGSTLLFQIHYTPYGVESSDQSQIGFRFAKKEPENELHVHGISNTGINIPAGAKDHKEVASITVPYDVYATALLPHMHVRGSGFKYELKFPDGREEVLLDVPRYDFNWQLTYRLKEPLFLPKGTKVICTAWYDNSEHNPANPDPESPVRWGLQTDDEMMLGYIEYYTADPSDQPIEKRG